MTDSYFYNADGEMLFVPQQGLLRLVTEMGVVETAPGEIAVVPRGSNSVPTCRMDRHGDMCAKTWGRRCDCPISDR